MLQRNQQIILYQIPSAKINVSDPVESRQFYNAEAIYDQKHDLMKSAASCGLKYTGHPVGGRSVPNTHPA